MKNTILTFLLIVFLNNLLVSQTTTGTGLEIDNNKLETFFSKNLSDYVGIYHFGDSEGESNLFIFVHNQNVCGQLRYSKWILNDNEEVIGARLIYYNLKNFRIDEDKLIADGWTGSFVIYNNKKGLIINNSDSDSKWKIENDIGIRLGADIGVYHYGEFTEASLRLLNEKELINKSKGDLKLMRNEIFARYGYKFVTGGEMEEYFKSKSWYSEKYDNVDLFLTDFEITNIELIQKIEKLKNSL